MKQALSAQVALRQTSVRSALLLSTLLFCSLTYGIDDTPKNRIAKAEAEIALATEALAMNTDCGTEIAVTIDWSDFPDDAFDYSVAGYCESLINALGSHCSGGKNKHAWISDNVTELVCAYSSADADNPTINFEGARVMGRFSFGMSNLDTGFKRALLESF